MQVPGDSAALFLLGGDDLPQQIDDVQLRCVMGLHFGGQRARAFVDTDFERSTRVAQRLRRLLLSGQVASDLGKPERAVAETGRDAARVEQAAVAPDVIALVERAPLPPRDGDLRVGDSVGAICGREQHLEVAADDLVGSIAEHPFGAGVPGINLTGIGHREDRIVGGAVDENPQTFFASLDIQFGAAAWRDVLEHQDQAVDAIVGRAIRPNPRQIPAAFERFDLAVDALQHVEDLVQVTIELVVAQSTRDIHQRPADIGRQEVEHIAGSRRRELHAQAPIQEDRRDVGRIDQILKVVVAEAQLLNLDFQFLVDRGQFLVDRLQFLLAGLELFCRRAELLVGGLLLFGRGLRFLDLGFVPVPPSSGAAF